MKALYIGIDPGVDTGFALYDKSAKKLVVIRTCMIHEAMALVIRYKAMSKVVSQGLFVIVEDARQRKYFGAGSDAKKQGAGSVKRDCKIWDDFLKSHEVDYVMRHPVKGGTKLNKEQFEKITGWTLGTSSHGRDAAMLVWGL